MEQAIKKDARRNIKALTGFLIHIKKRVCESFSVIKDL